jgi:hypothetical protein
MRAECSASTTLIHDPVAAQHGRSAVGVPARQQLFALWQQDRSRQRSIAEPQVFGALDDSAGAPGTHVFALKISTWWSVY